MDENLEKAFETLKQKVEQKAKELNDAKRAVNQLCVCIGEPLIYEITGESETGQLITDLKGHEYYMKPLATVIVNILERRGEKNGPITVKEIYEQMKAGGYLFETKNPENAMRNIRISMGKNTQTFHKLPNGKFGLVKWFPDLKEKKQANKVSLNETPQFATGSITTHPQQEAEPAVIVRKAGRPRKTEQTDKDKQE